MATYYYHSTSGPSDYDMDTNGNYWNDVEHTSAAGLKPGIGDTVIQLESIAAGTTSASWQTNTTNPVIAVGGTFNGSYTVTSGGYLTTNLGIPVFNGSVAVQSGGTLQIEKGTFNGAIEVFFPCTFDVTNAIGDFTLGTTGSISLNDSVSWPATTDVQSGVSYANGTLTGTFVAPAVANVLSGVNYGAASEFTGTYVAAATSNVKTGITYGAASALTGTYDGSDRHTDPGVANVEAGVEYKSNNATNNRTGTFAVPAETDVVAGVNYGAAAEFTGSLGGGAITITVA